ncbi:hypothetical protein L7F22_000442 [Adiantum nelumboides]|nr:hypothetical protein [Adiantum nelumboides]
MAARPLSPTKAKIIYTESEATAPLLPIKNVADDAAEFHDGYSGASFMSAVFSLTTSVVGAGIMGLPSAVKTLGLIPGILLIVLVGLLADAGVETMLKFSSAGKAISYGGLMADSFGRIGRIVLQVCVIVNNFGILVVYLIIIGDVMSGSTSGTVHHSGVLEEWAGRSTWWNSRLSVMFFTTLFILVPLVSFKHVDSLRLSSALSVALAVMFVFVMAAVTITKLAFGLVTMPRLFPNIGNEASLLELFEVVPVVVTAYICHQSVHPIVNELDKSDDAPGVVRTSLALCTSIYIAMSVFGFMLFGENTMVDVLSNFDTDLGVPYSTFLCDLVRVGYALHLVLVFPLLNFTLRLNLDGILFPAAVPISLDNKRFTLTTAGIVILIFLGAYLIPNINTAFQFTGATAAMCIGFIFPGIVCLRDLYEISTKKERLISWFMVVLAVTTGAIAITSDVLDLFVTESSTPSGPVGALFINE